VEREQAEREGRGCGGGKGKGAACYSSGAPVPPLIAEKKRLVDKVSFSCASLTTHPRPIRCQGTLLSRGERIDNKGTPAQDAEGEKHDLSEAFRREPPPQRNSDAIPNGKPREAV